jgi:hypothetical protein
VRDLLISNTGPLIALALIDRLDVIALLEKQGYTKIHRRQPGAARSRSGPGARLRRTRGERREYRRSSGNDRRDRAGRAVDDLVDQAL